MSNELPDEGEVSEELRRYLRVKQGVSTNTYKNHKSVASRFEEWLINEHNADTILDAEPQDVGDWLSELNDDGYAGSTLEQYLFTLRAVFSEWTDGGEDVSMLPSVLDQNPAGFELGSYFDVSTSAEKQQYADNDEGVIYLSPSEVRDLQRHVPNPRVRNTLLIKMLVQTGLRRAEISHIKIKDLNREKQSVTVREEVSKIDERREPAYDSLDPELTLYLDGGYRDHRTTSDSPYLFITDQSERLSPSRITSIVREAAEDAGLDEKYMTNAEGKDRRRVSAHALRSTFIMRLVDAGVPTAKVMELSGHERLETVEDYANVGSEDAREAYHEADIQFGTE
jgi:integrase/recombinase XerD